ncbi:MAG: hypothetical protein EBS48_01630 [Actinobacteria bacterium]|nr:hypothetical protein [Actinomycetota bacterium]NBR65859.1 hypothetical protein [Actinomycetota bacterium]NBU15710.1 hypothetical protein [Actinomycetota bacterium]
MGMKKFLVSVLAYSAAVTVGVYLASGNGTGTTVLFVAMSVAATAMSRRTVSAEPAEHFVDREVMETGRPPRITDYDIETVDDRVPFYLADADLFSRAS